MIIREIKKDEIADVVKVHTDSFKDFFLTELGDNFLNVYYNSIRKNRRGVLLGYFDQNQLCGFCAATILSKGFNKYLILNNLIDFGFVKIF